MQGRETFVEELVEKINAMIDNIEDRELMEPDLALVREFAEQLLEEVESLRE